MRNQPITIAMLMGMSMWACGGDDAGDDQVDTEQPSTHEDAGSTPVVDAGGGMTPKPPRTCDDPDTPGNDCPDAVGCREALECGLDTQSCCVPGFRINRVVCEDDLSCEEGSRASCDGPEDCDGRVCCVDIIAGKTECADSCDGTVLCHTTSDCASGQECARGTSFTWWGVCR